jgi:hypothetical protein
LDSTAKKLATKGNSMSRLDIVTAREGKDGKSFFTKIGVAWPNAKGGYRLVFEALPTGGLNREGKFEVTALLFPPRDDTGQQSGGGAGSSRVAASFDADLDSDVPF